MIRITVIIVSYNTREMTLKCLETLYARAGEGTYEVIVVDNASSDGSVDAIRQQFPAVRLIASERNLGFGAANNVALRKACGQYFLLLNSDAFPHVGCIQKLAEYLRAHPDVGLVGPRLCNADGSLQRSCWRFPTPARAWIEAFWLSRIFSGSAALGDYTRWAHDTEREVDFVIGACLLLNRKVYEQVGGFDERFFLYSEETDWQRRIRRAGWKVHFVPQAIATQLGGASGQAAPLTVSRLFFESFDKYFLKHHGLLGFLSMRLAQFVRYALRTMVWSVMIALPAQRVKAARELKKQLLLMRKQVFSSLPI